MKKREQLVSLALGLLSAQSTLMLSQAANANEIKKPEEVKCFGVNSCKSSAECSVSKEDIEAFNHAKIKFSNAQAHGCKSQAMCGGKDAKNPKNHVNLNWVKKSEDECFKANGFVIKNGKVVSKKS